MAEKDKKYYWLKLKRDFFKRHDIQIIEDMPNGKDYILFYLKLLCESVDHDGNLRFNEEIPYNEEMLSTITRTNIDTIRSAIKVFKQLKMLEILSDGTIYMREVQKMLGSETYWAERTRVHRAKQKYLTMSNESQMCQGKSIDIEKDKDKELEKEPEKEKELLNKSSINEIFDRWLKELEKVVASVTFESFFTKLKWIDVKDNKLIISGIHSYSASAIEERYGAKMKEAIAKASDGRLTDYLWRVE